MYLKTQLLQHSIFFYMHGQRVKIGLGYFCILPNTIVKNLNEYLFC